MRETLSEALAEALGAATHLESKHAATVAAARALAAKIDAWDTIVRWANEDAADTDRRPAVPANDNTSLPTFLKFMESLQLVPTPLSKQAAKSSPKADMPAADDPAGKIVSLQKRAASRKAN